LKSLHQLDVGKTTAISRWTNEEEEMTTDNAPHETFGSTIKRLRRGQGLTQRQLAAELGVDFTYLSKLENDRGERPSEKIVRELAARFEVDSEELLALAGRLPGELGERAKGDLTFARLLRRLPSMSDPELEKIYKQAKLKKPSP
jgi:HTH-type transcriptional regulator, competence development regulator